ncbi:MAG: homoserine O-acetyltransferase [Pyrinomonadaceae bacterium]
MASGLIDPTFEGDFTLAGGEPFKLAAGGELSSLTLRYTIYGRLNEAKDNAVLVCHALSGSSRIGDWWAEMFGAGRPFDTSRFCIIGINVVGSCYGSTGPCSIDPQTGEPYGIEFPLVTIEDMVATQALLIEHLGIRRLYAVVGGSIGGMQALEWAVSFPQSVERCVVIAATPLSAMGLALNHLQRQAIQNDAAWLSGRYAQHEQPAKGLGLARAIAMCSYKSAELFDERFHRRPDRTGEDPYRSLDERFDISGYLDYQGAAFTRRFDANTYLVISKAMDTFEFSRRYRSDEAALRRIEARITLVGITSDWLFPAADVKALSLKMENEAVRVVYRELESSHGHDGFLAEADKLALLLAAAFDETSVRHHTEVFKIPALAGSAIRRSD